MTGTNPGRMIGCGLPDSAERVEGGVVESTRPTA